MSITVVRAESLPYSNIAHEFVGDDHGVSITFLVVEAGAGRGPALHTHPYDEVIVVLEGEATLDDGIETRIVGRGDHAVIPAGQPHAFTNTGDTPLRHIDIHASPRFVSEWLEQRRAEHELTLTGTGDMARGIGLRALAGGHAVAKRGTSRKKARRLDRPRGEGDVCERHLEGRHAGDDVGGEGQPAARLPAPPRRGRRRDRDHRRLHRIDAGF
jgi:mannose-6-phosphate isomerase-like protein (cupin superfamily)